MDVDFQQTVTTVFPVEFNILNNGWLMIIDDQKEAFWYIDGFLTAVVVGTGNNQSNLIS